MIIRFSEIKKEFREAVEEEMPELKDMDITTTMLLKIGKMIFVSLFYAIYNMNVVDIGDIVIIPFNQRWSKEDFTQRKRKIKKLMNNKKIRFPFTL